MPSYRIIGDDQGEYGPVSAEQVRQWITEGRVDSETKVQVEGDAEWKLLAEVPEFAAALPGSASSKCPNCGEPFLEGFDSCWKCGTGKDGSPSKEWVSVRHNVKPPEPCPKCGSRNVRLGRLLPLEGWSSVMFKPEGTRFFKLRLVSGVVLLSERSLACLDCGLVWDYVRPGELKDFISRNCGEPGEEDGYALLSEAARLESQGDVARALAKYEDVMKKFPGTGVAKDAELSIRNLNEKMG